LYKWHVTLDVTFCMITKLMNKWILTSYSTGHMQIYNDAKINMADGAYKDVRGTKP
jgi:hypothetical protein